MMRTTEPTSTYHEPGADSGVVPIPFHLDLIAIEHDDDLRGALGEARLLGMRDADAAIVAVDLRDARGAAWAMAEAGMRVEDVSRARFEYRAEGRVPLVAIAMRRTDLAVLLARFGEHLPDAPPEHLPVAAISFGLGYAEALAWRPLTQLRPV